MKFKNCDEKTVNRLFELISSLENAEDVRVLLSDLCTEHEIEQRVQPMPALKKIVIFLRQPLAGCHAVYNMEKDIENF